MSTHFYRFKSDGKTVKSRSGRSGFALVSSKMIKLCLFVFIFGFVHSSSAESKLTKEMEDIFKMLEQQPSKFSRQTGLNSATPTVRYSKVSIFDRLPREPKVKRRDKYMMSEVEATTNAVPKASEHSVAIATTDAPEMDVGPSIKIERPIDAKFKHVSLMITSPEDSADISSILHHRYASLGRKEVKRIANGLCQADKRRNKRSISEVLETPKKWTKSFLTYRVHGKPNSMEKVQAHHAIYRAFKIWSKCSGLRFHEVSKGEADINIRFASGDHGDGPVNAFDGPGNHLAHALAPPHGEVHFDAEENWSKKSSARRHVIITSSEGKKKLQIRSYYSLLLAAVHEIGHSLGLKHTGEEEAIMYPVYADRKIHGKLRLHQSDISAIQSLYGRRRVNKEKTVFSPYISSLPIRRRTVEPPPDSCNTAVDAAFSDENYIYFFKNRYFWSWNTIIQSPQHPRKIKTKYRLSKPKVNAACYSDFSRRTYIFSGHKYWRYFGNMSETGYPRLLRDHGLPSRPGAAFQVPETEKILIFKRNKFFIFDELDENVTRTGQLVIQRHNRDKSKMTIRLYNAKNSLDKTLSEYDTERQKVQPVDGSMIHREFVYFFIRNSAFKMSKSHISNLISNEEIPLLRVTKRGMPWLLHCFS